MNILLHWPSFFLFWKKENFQFFFYLSSNNLYVIIEIEWFSNTKPAFKANNKYYMAQTNHI